jgi:cobalamin biosynthesis protein CobD/CbiB
MQELDVTESVSTDPTKPIDADKSLGELLSHLSQDFGQLVSTQVELAKVEIKEEVSRAAKGAGMVTGGGMAAMLAILLLSFAAAWGLAAVMPTGFAFLIIGVLWAVVAGVLVLSGRKQLSAVHPVPPNTKAALKEDLEWARQQKS